MNDYDGMNDHWLTTNLLQIIETGNFPPDIQYVFPSWSGPSERRVHIECSTARPQSCQRCKSIQHLNRITTFLFHVFLSLPEMFKQEVCYVAWRCRNQFLQSCQSSLQLIQNLTWITTFLFHFLSLPEMLQAAGMQNRAPELRIWCYRLSDFELEIP